MCAVIFQSTSDEIPANWKTGIDISVTPTSGKDDIDFIENNYGEENTYLVVLFGMFTQLRFPVLLEHLNTGE